MKHSENLAELGAAMAKAQGEMENAAKGKENPHFKSKYADLASCWDAIREPLSKNGLSVVQLPFTDEKGTLFLTTLITHASGQWIESTFSLPASKQDAQGLGSALTYMRRYALVGLGIAPEDDDGNAAVGRGAPAHAPAQTEDPRLKAMEWAKKAEAAILAMTKADDLQAWESKNQPSLVKLRAVSDAMYSRLLDVISETYTKLNAKVAAE